MATDMQPVFNTYPVHQPPAVQDARDRQPAFHGAEPSRNFESYLGRAESRQMRPSHEPASLNKGAGTKVQPRTAAHSTTESSGQPSERSAGCDSDERTMECSEPSEGKTQSSTGKSGEQSAAPHSQQESSEEGALPQEIVLAATMVPAAPAPPVEDQHSEPETEANGSEAAVNAIATSLENQPGEKTAPLPFLVAPAPAADVTAKGLPTSESGNMAEAGKDTTQTEAVAKDTLQADGGVVSPDAGRMSGLEADIAGAHETSADVPTQQDRPNPALAAMTAVKQEPRNAEQGLVDHPDRPAIIDALGQGTPVSEGQGGTGSERFMDQGGQSLYDSSAEGDRSLPDQPTFIDQNSRPTFLERMNGVTSSAPSASEGAFARGESGQTTGVLRASESERLGEFREMAPVSHSVTLDLDPLDMGPLRVRVMMSDHTVHAHIRTEHGELGQGLLQQGQSLETSLRTTGLEMGMLRVTVDQQQGRGDNAWLFQQQQQQSRTPSPNQSQGAPREDERAARGETGARANEHVSLFA